MTAIYQERTALYRSQRLRALDVIGETVMFLPYSLQQHSICLMIAYKISMETDSARILKRLVFEKMDR